MKHKKYLGRRKERKGGLLTEPHEATGSASVRSAKAPGKARKKKGGGADSGSVFG